MAKHKRKSSARASKVKVEPEVLDGSSSPTVPPSSDSPVVTQASDSGPIMDEVKFMVESFCDSMEASLVDSFIQVSSCSASPVQVSNVSSQVVYKCFFSSSLSSGCAPSACA